MAMTVGRFGWWVHEGGYQWITASPNVGHPWLSKSEELRLNKDVSPRELDPPEEWIILIPAVPQDAQRFYRPLTDHPGLFLEFANTPATPEGILKFANTYGLLGGRGGTDMAIWADEEMPAELLPYARDDDRLRLIMRVEPLRAWQYEIQDMRHAVMLWQALKKNDAATLARFVTWYGPDRVSFHPDPAQPPLIPEPDGQPALSWDVPLSGEARYRYRVGDVIEPARDCLQSIVNTFGPGKLLPLLEWEAEENEWRLHHLPEGLIDGLWYQFAQAVSGGTNYRQCQQCGTWFVVDPSVARADKQWCTTVCRNRAWRQRKATAAV